MQKKFLFSVIFSALLLGCSATDQRLIDEMQFSQWQLTKVDTNSYASSAYVRFIDAMQLEGNTGCNDFFASSQLVDEQLQVDNIGMTYKVCAQPDDAIEQALLNTLKSNPSLIVSVDTMILSGAHTLTFQRENRSVTNR